MADRCSPRPAHQNHPLRLGYLDVVSVVRTAPVHADPDPERPLSSVCHPQRRTGVGRRRRSHDMQRRRYQGTGGLHFTRPHTDCYHPLRTGNSIYSSVRRSVYMDNSLLLLERTLLRLFISLGLGISANKQCRCASCFLLRCG